MATTYPNSGRLSNNKYKDSDKKPDMTGEIVMKRRALQELLSEHDGEDIVIKLSGWNRSGQYGNFISLAWNNYKKKEEAAPAQKPEPAQQVDLDSEDVPF